jgi:hypothetical protein
LTSKTFSADELFVPPQLLGCVDAEGQLIVPNDQHSYVFYGPYLRVAEGFYKVILNITRKDDDHPIGEFEVFSANQIYFSTEVTGRGEFLIHLPMLTDLEFRFRACGRPFIFQNIEFEKIELASLDQKPISAKIGDYIWQGIHTSTSVEVLGRLASRSIETVTCSPSRVTAIPAWNDDKIISSSQQLSSAGFNLNAIREISTDTFHADVTLANECGHVKLADVLQEISVQDIKPIGDAFLDGLAERSGAIQVTLASEGVALCRCPFTSIALSSSHGFVVPVDELKQSYLFYYFKSVEPFYLVVAGFGGRKTFLYFPMSDVVVQLGDPAYDWGNHGIAIDSLKRLLIRNYAEVSQYLSRKTSPCLLGGSLNNLGHSIWNDLTGLIRFEERGLLDGIRQLVSYRFAFLKPETILDNAAGIAVTNIQSPDHLFSFYLTNGLIPVRPTSMTLDASMADRIVKAAQGQLTESARDEIRQAQEWGDIIWFNLRLHNKSYIEQIPAALMIMERAQLEGRKVVLFVDGMRDCDSLVESIAEAAGSAVIVVDGTKKTMEESISWAVASKAYVATIGSGLTLVTWLAGKPGVAHSEKAHLSQLDFWPLVRSDVPVPKSPRSEDITDIGSGAYCNYSINPNLINDLLWPLVESRVSSPHTSIE